MPPERRLATQLAIRSSQDDSLSWLERSLWPHADLIALGRELSDSDADWQIHAYSKTTHAFLAPTANHPGAGIMYNEVSARRAMVSLTVSSRRHSPERSQFPS